MVPRGGTESAPTLQQTHTPPIRRFVLVVVTVTVAVGMVFVGFMPVFEAGTNDRVLVVGVYLIVVAGAVCLNAITVEALYQPGRDPGSHPVKTAPAQVTLVADGRGTNLTQALSKPVNRAGTEPRKELS
jgi:hypothetical protein